jgi:membrane protease YdiL (CAAX protease family)
VSGYKNRDALAVYAVTAAMIPLTLISSSLIYSIVALVVAFNRHGGTPTEDQIRLIFETELTQGVQMIMLGVSANAIVFTFVPIWIASRRVPSSEAARDRLALRRSSLADHAIAVLGLIGLTTALDVIVQLIGLGNYGRIAELHDAISAIRPAERWPLALVLGVGAGIPEELFFRGYVMHRLASAQGKTAAMLISAALFGIFHLDPLHAPLAAAMGVFLGFVVLKTGSLYPAITAHTINNAFAAMTAGLEIDEVYLWPSLFVGIAAIAGAFRLIVRRHKDDERAIVW